MYIYLLCIHQDSILQREGCQINYDPRFVKAETVFTRVFFFSILEIFVKRSARTTGPISMKFGTQIVQSISECASMAFHIKPNSCSRCPPGSILKCLKHAFLKNLTLYHGGLLSDLPLENGTKFTRT